MLIRLFNASQPDGPLIVQFVATSPPAVGDLIDAANGGWRVVERDWRTDVKGERDTLAELSHIDLLVALVRLPEDGEWEGTDMEAHLPSDSTAARTPTPDGCGESR
jgi:hypothetical protein